MNASSDIVRHVIMNLLHSAPMSLVFLAGLAMALVKWRNFPFPSLLLCLGCALHLMVSFGTSIGYALLPRIQAPTPALFTVIAILTSLLHAIAAGLIILAVYARRPEPATPAPGG